MIYHILRPLNLLPRTVPCPHYCSNTFANIIFPFKFDYLYNRLSSAAEQMLRVWCIKPLVQSPALKQEGRRWGFALNVHLRCFFQGFNPTKYSIRLSLKLTSYIWKKSGSSFRAQRGFSPHDFSDHIRSLSRPSFASTSVSLWIPLSQRWEKPAQTEHKMTCIFSVEEKSWLNCH